MWVDLRLLESPVLKHNCTGVLTEQELRIILDFWLWQLSRWMKSWKLETPKKQWGINCEFMVL